MKKVIGLLSTLFIIFCFTGCEMISKFIDLDKLLELDKQEEESEIVVETIPVNFNNKEKEFKFDNDGKGFEGEVLLLKYNLSDSIIPASDTGKIVEIESNSRSAINNNSQNISDNDDEFVLQNTSSKVDLFQAKQREFISNISENYSRSVQSETNTVIESIRSELYILSDLDTNIYYKASVEDGSLIDLDQEGKYCRFYYTPINNSESEYVDDLQDELFNSDYVIQLKEVFDSIYETAISYLGTNKYTVSDSSKYANTESKVSIVIMDIDHDATENPDVITDGFFAPTDLLKKSNFEFSNQGQILYIDIYSLINRFDNTKSTLVHEFNHLLNAIQKNVKNSGNTDMKNWYTEMLSMLAEDMFAEKLNLTFSNTPKSRLATFKKSYHYGFTLWPIPEEEIDEINNMTIYPYTNTFAYGSYLVRNYGGVDLVKEIATNKYVNEEAIEKALYNCGFKNKTFEDTVKEYYIATKNTSKTGNTLNKETKKKDGLYFDAINLSQLKVENGKVYDRTPTALAYSTQNKLYPKGCTIYSIGNDVSSITIQRPENTEVEYEIVMFREVEIND